MTKSGVYTEHMSTMSHYITQPHLLKHGQAQSFFNKLLN